MKAPGDISLDGTWSFAYTPELAGLPPVIPDASLPHVSGVGWYKTALHVPEEWQGKSVVLEVGGAPLRAGELLLGTAPFPGRETSFQIAVAGRAHQNLALLVNNHPVFAGIPHEGFCDWQFRSLIHGGQCVVFNDLDVAFDPILEVVSSYKNMRWQAALWEAVAEGGGRLFVAGCRFDLADPGAVALLDGILRYVRSDAFRPRTRLSLDGVVRPLVARSARVEKIHETDMALDPNAQGAR